MRKEEHGTDSPGTQFPEKQFDRMLFRAYILRKGGDDEG